MISAIAFDCKYEIVSPNNLFIIVSEHIHRRTETHSGHFFDAKPIGIFYSAKFLRRDKFWFFCHVMSHEKTLYTGLLFICVLFPGTTPVPVDSEDTPVQTDRDSRPGGGYFIEDQPRFAIRSGGKSITRNVRRISDLAVTTAVSDVLPAALHVSWKTTPPSPSSSSVDGISACCSFTLLSVYPATDYAGPRRSRTTATATNVVLLTANVTAYTVHLEPLGDFGGVPSLSQKSDEESGPSMSQKSQVDIGAKFVVCVQIWHRNRGVEKKLDESCVSTVLGADSAASWTSNRKILIIFIVVIGVNLLLILTLVVVRLRQGKPSPLPFSVKKWWKDVSDGLHVEQTASRIEVLQENGRGEVNGGLSVVTPTPSRALTAGSLNNAMYAQNLSGRYQYPMGGGNVGPMPTPLMRSVFENGYYGVEGWPAAAGGPTELPPPEYYANFYAGLPQPAIRPSQIYYVRNGLYCESPHTATV